MATVAGKLRTSGGGIFIPLCVWSLSFSSEERFLIATGCFSQTEIKVTHHIRFLESIASSEIDKMERQKIWLRPILSGGKCTEVYECSLCGGLFRSNPERPFDMPLLFGLHASEIHPGATLSRQSKNSSQPSPEAMSGDSESE
jgi:hypothetical protein